MEKSDHELNSDVNIYVGLAKMVIQIFPEDVIVKPEWTFWPTQYMCIYMCIYAFLTIFLSCFLEKIVLSIIGYI